ncbi:outer membrane protein (porin)-like protein [Caballeronia hypogeia]|uniref:Outer membrane protein (Porin)-like protein n=1 Tax=Caballeronia hypogeia TaxID=1777140 RepID=A0A158CD73_9BURK|nr:porin [Caballeronia hypogeia]SAK79856.1 outer membrane protein (porin)-like protein [Caballeronia hypogeia]
MRKTLLGVGATAGCLLSLGAHAQGSVTLYGIVDVGIQYVDNAGGHAQTQEASGMFNGNRFGLKGVEDLGGNWHALFQLENGFNTNNGTFGQGTSASGTTQAVTRMFGRQSWVGLQSPWATISLGRQYDFFYDNLAPIAASNYVGSFMHRPGTANAIFGNNGSTTDFDRIGGVRVDNSAKLTSAPIGGFTLGAMYGFGGQAGAFSNGSTQSFGAKYANGGLLAGAVYTNYKENNAASSYQTYGGGARYQFGPVRIAGLYTNARWSATGDRVDTIEFGGQYRITPSLAVAAGYFYSKPNNESTNVIMKGTRNQVGFMTDYSLSKTTDIYATVDYQRAKHGYAAQIYSLTPTDAKTNHQLMIGAGLQHFF